MNRQAVLDTRNLMTGKDGELFVTASDGSNISLAEVDTFQVQLNVTNTDYQPVGSALTFAVNTGFSITLTFTEAVVRDDVMLEKLIADLNAGFIPQFDFQGKLHRGDKEERQVFRNCIPDGTIDLMNITPGEIIKRSWSFRVNGYPKLMDNLK